MAEDKGKGKAIDSPEETEIQAISEKPRSKSGTKPRASRAGTRSVSTLSAEQLARKRVNDREAQRAIRQRTREHVERLEGRIRELVGDGRDNSDTESALVKARHRNLELEEELRVLRATLAGSISSTASPDIRYPHFGCGSPSIGEPSTSSYPSCWAPQDVNAVPAVFSPNPASAPKANPTWTTQAGIYEDHGRPRSHSGYRPVAPLGPSSTNPSFDSGYSSNLGSDENASQEGTSTQHRHVRQFNTRLTTLTERRTQFRSDGTSNLWPAPVEPSPLHRSTTQPGSAAIAASPDHQAYVSSSSLINQPSHAAWELPLCISPSTTVSDDLLVSMIQRMRSLRLEGVAGAALIGPTEPSLVPLLQPENPRPVHVMALNVSEMLRVLPLRGFAEKIGVFILVYPLIQWLIAPSNETYQNLPECYIPQASQLNTPHPLWVSMVGWPSLRDVIIGNQEKYASEQFEYLWEVCINVNWPYGTQNVVEQVGDDWRVTEVFRRHAMNLSNWSMDEPFQRTYPELRDFVKFTDYSGQSQGLGNVDSGSVPQ